MISGPILHALITKYYICLIVSLILFFLVITFSLLILEHLKNDYLHGYIEENQEITEHSNNH